MDKVERATRSDKKIVVKFFSLSPYRSGSVAAAIKNGRLRGLGGSDFHCFCLPLLQSYLPWLAPSPLISALLSSRNPGRGVYRHVHFANARKHRCANVPPGMAGASCIGYLLFTLTNPFFLLPPSTIPSVSCCLVCFFFLSSLL